MTDIWRWQLCEYVRLVYEHLLLCACPKLLLLSLFRPLQAHLLWDEELKCTLLKGDRGNALLPKKIKNCVNIFLYTMVKIKLHRKQIKLHVSNNDIYYRFTYRIITEPQTYLIVLKIPTFNLSVFTTTKQIRMSAAYC